MAKIFIKEHVFMYELVNSKIVFQHSLLFGNCYIEEVSSGIYKSSYNIKDSTATPDFNKIVEIAIERFKTILETKS